MARAVSLDIKLSHRGSASLHTHNKRVITNWMKIITKTVIIVCSWFILRAFWHISSCVQGASRSRFRDNPNSVGKLFTTLCSNHASWKKCLVILRYIQGTCRMWIVPSFCSVSFNAILLWERHDVSSLREGETEYQLNFFLCSSKSGRRMG